MGVDITHKSTIIKNHHDKTKHNNNSLQIYKIYYSYEILMLRKFSIKLLDQSWWSDGRQDVVIKSEKTMSEVYGYTVMMIFTYWNSTLFCLYSVGIGGDIYEHGERPTFMSRYNHAFPGDLIPAWWRYQMETFSALLDICAGNSPVPGEFPAQRPVTRSFDVFFDLRLNNRLSKQSWDWWFETPSWSSWRHCNN